MKTKFEVQGVMFDIRELFNVINKDLMMGNNNIKWGGLSLYGGTILYQRHLKN